MEKFYWADVGFLEPGRDGNERAYSIRFASDGDERAVRDAFRWARNRCANLPEIFGKHVNLKVGECRPQRIGNDGEYHGDAWSFIYEWKCDTGEHGRVRVGAPASMFDRIVIHKDGDSNNNGIGNLEIRAKP